MAWHNNVSCCRMLTPRADCKGKGQDQDKAMVHCRLHPRHPYWGPCTNNASVIGARRCLAFILVHFTRADGFTRRAQCERTFTTVPVSWRRLWARSTSECRLPRDAIRVIQPHLYCDAIKASAGIQREYILAESTQYSLRLTTRPEPGLQFRL